MAGRAADARPSSRVFSPSQTLAHHMPACMSLRVLDPLKSVLSSLDKRGKSRRGSSVWAWSRHRARCHTRPRSFRGASTPGDFYCGGFLLPAFLPYSINRRRGVVLGSEPFTSRPSGTTIAQVCGRRHLAGGARGRARQLAHGGAQRESRMSAAGIWHSASSGCFWLSCPWSCLTTCHWTLSTVRVQVGRRRVAGAAGTRGFRPFTGRDCGRRLPLSTAPLSPARGSTGMEGRENHKQTVAKIHFSLYLFGCLFS